MAWIGGHATSHCATDSWARRIAIRGEVVGGAGNERRGDVSLGVVFIGVVLLLVSDGLRTMSGGGIESWWGRGTKTRDTRSSGELSRFRGSN